MQDTNKTVEGPVPSHHLLIAGTGRAGTSFLVRYLSALGLDTGYKPDDKSQAWEANANAGLERLPLVEPNENLPYVLKSPWSGEYIDEILASNRFSFDAIIIPMRDLVEAASSRSILEHRHLHQTVGWMADRLDATWEVFAYTPGGIIYSLNPLDQARLLALGFHRLVHGAAKACIPLVFPVFPRMVEDWSYLYETLKPILPATITAEAARSAHDQVASMSLVRVGSELGGSGPNQAAETAGQSIHRYPTTSDIDLIALRRELTRLRQERQAAADDVARLSNDVTRLSAQCNTIEAEVKRLEMELETAQKYEEENAIILGRLGNLLNSKSWRLTAPLRKLVDTVRPKRRI
ncbi:hypothetical protein [Rhizobium sp. RCAM05973]|uniref:hypothetical protein n=1 Tax=Rhizobium sp. RCAM05973 TaxID=2994066 RepID=UPI0022EBD1C8|nr:hypothetical protein [Rhizobium sp. RCAM05973]